MTDPDNNTPIMTTNNDPVAEMLARSMDTEIMRDYISYNLVKAIYAGKIWGFLVYKDQNNYLRYKTMNQNGGMGDADDSTTD